MKVPKDECNVVGFINHEVATLGEFPFSGKVYMAPGVVKHVMRKHGKDLGKYIISHIEDYIEEIITNPEYVGCHPKKVGTSLELVKKLDKNLLVALEVDLEEDYIYVASFYPITPSKLENRIFSGRFKENCIDCDKKVQYN
ncbi:hypothetical protein CS063_06045 [Sporanaerobium hydrogeniformans]|uniref:Uncharacterized protein n=1 Tax=Sporanaerobium hydrogeniformans TaxID=3072179 RepID=A0AC61DDL3_9FIRM|nr:hypothetical protein [Sporanaerobium hydrogeniformans]PHV71250.1 hypothetical protein CS063_06045 [Sporanaerobium hydrogeniformans]